MDKHQRKVTDAQRQQAEERRIRAHYRSIAHRTHHGNWHSTAYNIWMPLARWWKRPIREIKRIVGHSSVRRNDGALR